MASRRSSWGGAMETYWAAPAAARDHVAAFDRPSTVCVPVKSARAARGGAQQQGDHEASISAPSAEVKFAGGGGQIRGARRAGSGGLQAAPVATRTSPDTLGPGPRAGSSGAGHRASRGPSSSGSAEFRINSAPF